jgi:beta-mannosidase
MVQKLNISEYIPLVWEIGFVSKINEVPAKWYPATVPGAVQLDMAKGLNYGSYFYAENWEDYLWMEDVYWTYKTGFNKPVLSEGDLCYFVSKGIDYRFEIILNKQRIFIQEGMFKSVELELNDFLKEHNTLEVVIYPVPKIRRTLENPFRANAAQSAKPAVSYGWDWHPRLIPSGIWDETFIETRNPSHLNDVFVDYVLSDDFQTVEIQLKVVGKNLENTQYDWKLIDSNGKIVVKKDGELSNLSDEKIEFKNPLLWWTHDHGTPNLYISEFILKRGNKLLDSKVGKVGFRKIQLVMHDGAWNKPDTFPKSRSNPPITIELNGRILFGKGTNWVNPEIFPGIITNERYNELLDRAIEANFNILRVWGGGIVNKESFYELCDEKGILVWTEFPLACNNYEGTPHYLSILKQESEAIIKRIRKHSSNAIWCGGNELFNSWSGMTDQSLALRLLNSQCFLFDPKTAFLPTSPLMGMAHGNYVFRYFDTGKEVFQEIPKSIATAYTEFGVPGTASVELLKKIIPESELFPPKPETSWESHHAFKAYEGDTWLMKDMLESYFGIAENIESIVEQSQWLQEGYKCIYEEARRQKPVCSMALNWCYNEPWITAANNSIISYPNLPKPAFFAVADSCRPFLASARIPKFSWTVGEAFSAKIFILNDLYENIPQSGVVSIKLKAESNETIISRWKFGTAERNKNIEGPNIHIVLPKWNTDRFELILEVEGNEKFSSKYVLQYRIS